MDKQLFLNRIRAMHFIDRRQLLELNERDWLEFRIDPCRFIITCSDQKSDAIWREVEGRQK